jgi:hypothetical protein
VVPTSPLGVPPPSTLASAMNADDDQVVDGGETDELRHASTLNACRLFHIFVASSLKQKLNAHN